MDTIRHHVYSPLVVQQSIWQAAHALRLPVAVWRLPQADTVHCVIDLSGQPLQTAIDLDELPQGFAFCPFEGRQDEGGLFLQAHIHYIFRKHYWEEIDSFIPSHLLPKYEQFKEKASQYSQQVVAATAMSAYAGEQGRGANEEDAESRFKAAVQRAVSAIEKGVFQKVVLSRRKKVALPEAFDLLQTYGRLCRQYPNAFVSLVSVSDKGTWMGASPEILVSIDKYQQFRTVALAGTQPLLPEVLPAHAAWTQKEIEEQAFVSRYIINCFKQIRLREFEEDGPKTVVAGNLMHLRTDFQVDMQATGFPQLGTVMLGLLHPTSAVCGMPKDTALEFILKNEGHSRDFYSGYLGPVNIDQESHLYVNLRCTQWMSDGAVLYAGAGITAHSIPEKEWRETELKCQTMYRVLHEES